MEGTKSMEAGKTGSKGGEGAKAATGATRQFCTFNVSDRLYGADILEVKEITGETSITPVFHAPPEVRGLVNIRGQINLVLDLRLLLGFEAKEPGPDSRIILFKPESGESFGLLVDSVGDVADTDGSMMEWRPERDSAKSGARRMETGVCKLDRGLLVIINPAAALPSIQEKLQTLK